MNCGNCWQITFNHPPKDIEAFDNFMEEYFEVTACNYDDNGEDEYVGYKSLDFKEEDMLQAALFFNIELPPYTISFLESKNWLAENVIKFSPVEVEEFLIYGVHEQTPPQTDRLAMRIYAATAFGSEHQTTKSCLKAISEFNKISSNHAKILDMGTGSGILALACAKLWDNNTHIIAVDIDEEAVLVTQSNATDNNLSNQITAEVSDGYSSALVKNQAPYDLIISNILARPLIEMAPSLSACLKPQGYCILSGFVEEQEDWVINAHVEQGLKLVKTYRLDNWRAALMEKI